MCRMIAQVPITEHRGGQLVGYFKWMSQRICYIMGHVVKSVQKPDQVAYRFSKLGNQNKDRFRKLMASFSGGTFEIPSESTSKGAKREQGVSEVRTLHGQRCTVCVYIYALHTVPQGHMYMHCLRRHRGHLKSYI